MVNFMMMAIDAIDIFNLTLKKNPPCEFIVPIYCIICHYFCLFLQSQ